MIRKPGREPPTYTVHPIHSVAGQVDLATRKLTTADLTKAMETYQTTLGVTFGTVIGITRDGLFASEREGWHPDQPDAFDEPLLIMPWVLILRRCLRFAKL